MKLTRTPTSGAVPAAVTALALITATACSSSHKAATATSFPGSVAASSSSAPTSAGGTSPAAGLTSAGAAAPNSAAASPTGAHATETSPAGDIPDSTVYVAYQLPGGGVTVSVPEGWARSQTSSAVTFTDKLNSIVLSTATATSAPTVASATQTTVPQLQGSVSAFKLLGVSTVQRKAGTTVLVHYQADSAPNPVTGKVIRDDVQRYEFFHGGTEVDVTLSGPSSADNVDPWKTVTDSLQWK